MNESVMVRLSGRKACGSWPKPVESTREATPVPDNGLCGPVRKRASHDEIAMKPTLIIDADDTLWESEIYYQQATTAFAEQMMSQGFGQAEAEEFLEMVERERVPQVGYAPQQFACSLVVAYQRLCKRYYRPFNDRVSESVRRTGLEVAEHPILLLKGVAETLAQLSGHCHLLLLTKGIKKCRRARWRARVSATSLLACTWCRKRTPG